MKNSTYADLATTQYYGDIWCTYDGNEKAAMSARHHVLTVSK